MTPQQQRPSTWGTTATLTTEGKRAVSALTVLGVAVVLVLAVLSEDVSFAAYAEVVGTVVAAGLVALGGFGAVGTYGHSKQYHQTGSPTGKLHGPQHPGLIGPQALDPANRPPGDAQAVD